MLKSRLFLAALAVLALATAIVVFPRDTEVPHVSTSTPEVRQIISLPGQLENLNFELEEEGGYDSSDAGRYIATQTWISTSTDRTVHLTDAWPGESGVFVIDIVGVDDSTWRCRPYGLEQEAAEAIANSEQLVADIAAGEVKTSPSVLEGEVVANRDSITCYYSP